MVLFYHIWIKTVLDRVSNGTWKEEVGNVKRRAEEIARVDQYNESNQSKTLENKSPLYILENRIFSTWRKVRAEEIFVNG